MNDQHPNAPVEGVVVPHDALSDRALRGLVEAFVLREGTEYGPVDVPLDEKVAAVVRQLARGEARIVFDPRTESTDIVSAQARKGR